jgi:hypothetical protein
MIPWKARRSRARDQHVRARRILATLILVLAPALAAAADYVRDEIRINMRTGAGNQFRIVKVLTSGDAVTRISESDGWINVKTPAGEEGWVPVGYLTAEAPASVTLPRVEARLAQAQAQIETLQQKLSTQAEAVAELDTLRSRNLELENENIALGGSDRWKTLGMGALIVLVGLGIGASWRSGGASRTRRIKL